MSTRKRGVAVIAAPGPTRDTLGHYLRCSGFDVHECSELGVATAFSALVLLASSTETLLSDVRSRLKAARTQRVVVVTSKPTALRDVEAAFSDRLRVLAAPAFGWEVVDALRATGMLRPRGA